jgi:ubiquinone/menaquinone biosynthesis C-methylase UbiE
MNNSELRRFYEGYFRIRNVLPTERLKQASRIAALQKMFPGGSGVTCFLGCGEGEETSIANGQIVGVDISTYALRSAKSRFPHDFLAGDAHMLPFRSDCFDCLVCSEVIEHVSDGKKVLSEMARVTKRRGILVLSTPNRWSLYGLFRSLAERITGQPVTAGNQPIDNEYTYPELRKLLEPFFSICSVLGCWYFPPTGKGEALQLPQPIMYRLFDSLLPLDPFLGRKLPFLGHMIVLKCMVKS